GSPACGSVTDVLLPGRAILRKRQVRARGSGAENGHVALLIIQPRTGTEWSDARRLIEEYAASLNVDLTFQNLAHELDHLAEQYVPPDGAFLLAKQDGVVIGCVGLRKSGEGVAEMKRLYTVSAARGSGVGRLLAERIV